LALFGTTYFRASFKSPKGPGRLQAIPGPFHFPFWDQPPFLGLNSPFGISHWVWGQNHFWWVRPGQNNRGNFPAPEGARKLVSRCLTLSHRETKPRCAEWSIPKKGAFSIKTPGTTLGGTCLIGFPHRFTRGNGCRFNFRCVSQPPLSSFSHKSTGFCVARI